MKNISSLVEGALKKHSKVDLPELKESITSNLEFRLFFDIDFSKPFKDAKVIFLKKYFHDLLTLSLGNISLAAKKAHLHRRHLHRLINELDIKPDEHRKEMIKPSLYMKENVYNILEESFDKIQQSKKIKDVYSNLDDISQILAQNIDNASYDDAMDFFEKEFITHALKENEFNIAKTAKALSMNERTLYRKINKLNIEMV